MMALSSSSLRVLPPAAAAGESMTERKSKGSRNQGLHRAALQGGVKVSCRAPSSFLGRSLPPLLHEPNSSSSSRSSRKQRRRSIEQEAAASAAAVVSVRSHTETAAAEVDRSACPAVKPEVEQQQFDAVDLRVGLITDAKLVVDDEMTKKRGQLTHSRRFLQLKVDIGCESRTVVSECRYVMDVEDAVGKKVLFVANVKPTTVLGIESHGIILTGLNYDPTPMPRSFKLILPGLGRLPAGSQVIPATVPK